MMTLNEALARNRMFWAKYVKLYGADIKPPPTIFSGRKIVLFSKIYPHLVNKNYPHCFACHYNMERPLTDHCNARCIIPWTGGGHCDSPMSPYHNQDAQGVLDCIDEAIKKYDIKALAKEHKKYMRRLLKNITISTRR